MTTKERLHQLVDQLPESETEKAERFLEGLAGGGDVEELDPETVAWLDAGLSDMAGIEPYDWGPDGPPPVKPVRYLPGVGFVIEGLSDDE